MVFIIFGKRLATLRKEKGISQYEFADRIGFSRGQVANYEQGKREPDYETLQKIADFFNVSTDYLLGRTDNPDLIEEKNEESLLDPELGVFFKEIKNAPEDRQEQLRKIWEIIKSEGNREAGDKQ
ncbi:helix-turn-helix domain-containing protein [Priestia flexa]|uniref:helix-turn-helix domain-containing protein n=1 Tax=Priestia flexa TaxID=86664 RepID=UPI003991C317